MFHFVHLGPELPGFIVAALIVQVAFKDLIFELDSDPLFFLAACDQICVVDLIKVGTLIIELQQLFLKLTLSLLRLQYD
jgi:hypothetical protein